MESIVVLEDGTVYKGKTFGASGENTGEVVFNTSMTGYQEILTDPSYKGQIVTMTYPLIGNYGINPDDIESGRIQVEGFIVKELCKIPSNFRAKEGLSKYLEKNNIIGIEGIDTRALTRHIRLAGAMKGIISTVDFDKKSLIKKAKQFPGLIGRDFVKDVTCKEPYIWPQNSRKQAKYKIAVIDCGVKYNILRRLEQEGCSVIVMPATVDAQDILKLNVDGLFISNGPGDPAGVPYIVNTLKALIGKLPMFGICFGHQLLALAFGGRTYKLKFGHRGANHPVKDIVADKIEITVQNHGFCVDMDSLPEDEVEITHINLNDHTCEGIRHRKYPIFSVQYHPEASPGPHDASYIFDEFIKMIENNK